MRVHLLDLRILPGILMFLADRYYHQRMREFIAHYFIVEVVVVSV